MEEKVVNKPICSLIGFLSGLISVGCCPFEFFLLFTWMLALLTNKSALYTNGDPLLGFLVSCPMVGIAMGLTAVVTSAGGFVRQEDNKILRIMGLVLGVAGLVTHVVVIVIGWQYMPWA